MDTSDANTRAQIRVLHRQLRRLFFGDPTGVRYWRIIADVVRAYNALLNARLGEWTPESERMKKEKYIATDDELRAVMAADALNAAFRACWKAVEARVHEGLEALGRNVIKFDFGTFERVQGHCVDLPRDEPNLELDE